MYVLLIQRQCPLFQWGMQYDRTINSAEVLTIFNHFVNKRFAVVNYIANDTRAVAIIFSVYKETHTDECCDCHEYET